MKVTAVATFVYTQIKDCKVKCPVCKCRVAAAQLRWQPDTGEMGMAECAPCGWQEWRRIKT